MSVNQNVCGCVVGYDFCERLLCAHDLLYQLVWQSPAKWLLLVVCLRRPSRTDDAGMDRGCGFRLHGRGSGDPIPGCASTALV